MSSVAIAPLDPEAFLAKAGRGHGVAEYGDGEVVFGQGDPADAVFFIRRGKVKIP